MPPQHYFSMSYDVPRKRVSVGTEVACYNENGGRIRAIGPYPVCSCGGRVILLKDAFGRHPGSAVCCRSVIEAYQLKETEKRMPGHRVPIFWR